MAERWRKRELKLYNSMTRKSEPFTPRDPGNVGIFVCGIIAYDLSYLGHARSVVAFDVFVRYLKYSGSITSPTSAISPTSKTIAYNE